jgi:threonine dehydrogenase-like Zn-dependent dehydrogenase
MKEDQIPEGEYHVVVDATGAPGGFRAARRAVRPTGVLLMKSTYADTLTLDASSLVVDEITLIGSRCGPFEPALRLLEKGLVNPEPLIAGIYPLESWNQAFKKVQQKGVLKILFDMRES